MLEAQRRRTVSVTYYCKTNILKLCILKQEVFVVSHVYRESGIWDWLSQVVLAQGLSWGQAVNQGCSLWRLDWSQRTHFQVHSHGCQQVASCHVGPFHGFAQVATFPKANHLRETVCLRENPKL